MFVFAYAAGHGLSDMRQFFMLNESSPEKALYPIEEDLRILSQLGKADCFVLAVYDMCREDATEFKVLVSKKRE